MGVRECTACRRTREIRAKGLCGSCYQTRNRTPAKKKETYKGLCSVKDCGCRVHAKGLCLLHLKESGANVALDTNHVLYRRWTENKKLGMHAEWAEDFGAFKKGVGEPVTNNARLVRKDKSKPLVPGNTEWVPVRTAKIQGESIREYNGRRYRIDHQAGVPYTKLSQFIRRGIVISGTAYDALQKKQRGLCAVCGKAETTKAKHGQPRSLAVDHCHTTGTIRGLLCRRCNMALGGFYDSPELLRAALKYLLAP